MNKTLRLLRKFFFLFATMLPLIASAQAEPPRNADGKITYKEVVPVEADQAELYKRAQLAVPAQATDVAKQSPEEVKWRKSKDLLINSTLGQVVNMKLFYSVSLQEKDGRYMYTITDLAFETKKGRETVLTPVEEGNVYKPLPQNLYYKGGALRPQGKALLAVQDSYKNEIEKAITSEVENIKRVMASPAGDDW